MGAAAQDRDLGGLFGGPSLQERFEAFDRANPDVWREFERLARELHSRGVRRYGAKAIMEVIRYHRAVSRDLSPSEPFKVNNSYISRYARKLIDADPRFAEFFETRELKAD